MKKGGNSGEACLRSGEHVVICPCGQVHMGVSARVPGGAGWWCAQVVLIMFVWAHVHLVTTAAAQSSGQLRFRFEPPQGVSYVLDGKYRLSDKEITLSEGRHHFTFWAPERSLLDTAFFVVADRTTDVLVRLRYSAEYVDHRRALERHARQERTGRIVPPLLAGGAAAWTTVAVLQLAGAHKDLEELEDSYAQLSDPAGIIRLKEQEIPAAKDELRQARTHALVAGGTFVVTAAATVWIRQRLAQRKPPAFEDRERIRFEGLVQAPATMGHAWCAQFSFPIR